MKVEDITPIDIDAGFEKREPASSMCERDVRQLQYQIKAAFRQINEVRQETQSLRFGIDDLKIALNRERNRGIRGWLRRLFGGS